MYIRGIVIFITCSRFFTFCLHVYTFFLANYILFNTDVDMVIFASIIVFIPYSVAVALKLIVMLGKTLNIKDVDKIFKGKRQERYRRLIEEQLELKGCEHVQLDDRGYFYYSNSAVISFIKATLLTEKEVIEGRRFASAQESMQTPGEDRRTLHILTYILEPDAIKKKVDAIKQKQERREGGAAGSWQNKRKTALDVEELTSAESNKRVARDETSIVDLERQAVFELLRELDPAKLDELFDKYIDKVTAEVEADMAKMDGLGSMTGVVERITGDRVNKRLLEGGLKSVWFLKGKGGAADRFIYYDVHHHITETEWIKLQHPSTTGVDSKAKSADDVNEELAGLQSQHPWLSNVVFDNRKFVFMEHMEIFEEEEHIKTGQTFNERDFFCPLSMADQLKESGARDNVAKWLDEEIGKVTEKYENEDFVTSMDAGRVLFDQLSHATNESMYMLVLAMRDEIKVK